MGIEGIKQFLKTKGIKCHHPIPLRMLENETIAVDFLNWIFRYNIAVGSEIVNEQEDILEEIDQEKIYIKMVEKLCKFVEKFLQFNIVLVFIMDGESQSNKTATKNDRKKYRQASMDKMNNLRDQLKAMNPFERPPELMESYRKMLSRNIKIKRNTTNRIIDFIKNSGLPLIVSKDEAENLASSLSYYKRIKAVWSADTDTYPLGARLVVMGFEYQNIKGESVLCINGTFTSVIRNELDLDYSQFRDFCIMLGTDFNERIYGIGPKKSYTLIQKYKDIQKISEETKHNTSCLNFQEVRKQLSPYDTSFITDDMLKINKKNIDISDNLMRNTIINNFIVKIKNT